MFKIRIQIFSVFISAISFAQIIKVEKNPFIKIDSVGTTLNFSVSKDGGISKLFDGQKTATIFVMPNAKPKNVSLYAALKGKKRDDSVYNMPNAFHKRLEIAKK